MSRHDAVKALNIYKRAGQQVYYPFTLGWAGFVQTFLLSLFFSLSLYHYSHFLNYFLRVTQAESLADFYEYCKGLELARNFQFPTLRQVPLCTELKYFSQCHLMNLINFILWISSRLHLFLQLWKNTLEKHPSLVPFRRDWWENLSMWSWALSFLWMYAYLS